MSIQFTQFLRPNGARRPILIDLEDKSVEKMAHDLIAVGFRFEIEELRTGEINMDCNNGDIVLDQQLCENGPPVVIAVYKLVKTSYQRYMDFLDVKGNNG